MTQGFGFTVVLETQAHSRLRNCFSGAAVESRDKSDSGIIINPRPLAYYIKYNGWFLIYRTFYQ